MDHAIATDAASEIADKQRYVALCTEIAEIKHKMLGSGRLPNHEFRALSARRAQVVAELNEINGRQAARKSLRQETAQSENQVKTVRKVEVNETQRRMLEMIRSLGRLRENYQQQSTDRTRTEAVRFMANQFQEQLGKIIAGNA